MQKIDKKIYIILSMIVILLFSIFSLKDTNLINKNTKIVEVKREKEPLIVFTFDDGFKTDKTVIFKLFKTYGVKGTSYIVPDLIGKYNRLTVEDLFEMKKQGWDIQDHTFKHSDLTKLDYYKIVEDLKKSDEFFINNLGVKAEHSALPFGSFDNRVYEIFKKYRKTLRNIFISANYREYDNSEVIQTYEDINLNLITAFNIDFKNTTEKSKDRVKSLIDDAIKNKGILILFSHESLENPQNFSESKIDDIEELVKYAKEKNMKFVTVSELYSIVKEYRRK